MGVGPDVFLGVLIAVIRHVLEADDPVALESDDEVDEEVAVADAMRAAASQSDEKL